MLVSTPLVGVPKAGVTSVGLVRVLLVRVSAPANVDNVPVVGKVMAVVAVAVRVVAKAPDVVRLPPSVIVLLVFATPVPPLAPGSIPVTPVVKGKPVALVSVADVGVPSMGVTSVGLVANTLAPVPVSSVKAAARFALLGVAKKVATPVPSPATPVLIGKPVALVSVADVGVPRIGVTNVGLVDRTLLPEPVEVVTPVPPLRTGSTPVRLETTLDVTLM